MDRKIFRRDERERTRHGGIVDVNARRRGFTLREADNAPHIYTRTRASACNRA